MVALVFSDVVGATEGQSLEFVASGPTVPPSTTPQDAIAILHQFGLAEEFSDVVQLLGMGSFQMVWRK